MCVWLLIKRRRIGHTGLDTHDYRLPRRAQRRLGEWSLGLSRRKTHSSLADGPDPGPTGAHRPRPQPPCWETPTTCLDLGLHYACAGCQAFCSISTHRPIFCVDCEQIPHRSLIVRFSLVSTTEAAFYCIVHTHRAVRGACQSKSLHRAAPYGRGRAPGSIRQPARRGRLSQHRRQRSDTTRIRH